MSEELINTLECPGEFDAMTKLRPGEPYFLLLGRDRLAPPLVQKWADDNRARALAEFDEDKIDREKRDRELRKSTQAEALGWAMKSFKAGDIAKKLAGEPTVKTYTGATIPEEQQQRDTLASARNRAAAAIIVAVGELGNVAEALEPFIQKAEDAKLCDLAELVQGAMDALRSLSEQVVSWRPIGVKAQP